MRKLCHLNVIEVFECPGVKVQLSKFKLAVVAIYQKPNNGKIKLYLSYNINFIIGIGLNLKFLYKNERHVRNFI